MWWPHIYQMQIAWALCSERLCIVGNFYMMFYVFVFIIHVYIDKLSRQDLNLDLVFGNLFPSTLSIMFGPHFKYHLWHAYVFIWAVFYHLHQSGHSYEEEARMHFTWKVTHIKGKCRTVWDNRLDGGITMVPFGLSYPTCT